MISSKLRHRQARYSAREDDKQWVQDTCQEARFQWQGRQSHRPCHVSKDTVGGVFTPPPGSSDVDAAEPGARVLRLSGGLGFCAARLAAGKDLPEAKSLVGSCKTRNRE
jgi:hypothetical protein